MAPAQFHIVDYVVSGGVLVFSLSIGLFYARKGEQNTRVYFMGDRKINIIPLATSMAASYVSSITILGASAEVI